MKQLDYLISQIQEVYNGKPWYGNSVSETLKIISYENCNNLVVQNSHSIANILRHMINWKKFVIEKLRYNLDFDIEMNSPQDWFDVKIKSEKDCAELISEYKKVHEELMTELQKFDAENLNQIVGKREYNVLFMLEGIVQHEIYHLGQINMILSLLKKLE